MAGFIEQAAEEITGSPGPPCITQKGVARSDQVWTALYEVMIIKAQGQRHALGLLMLSRGNWVR